MFHINFYVDCLLNATYLFLIYLFYLTYFIKLKWMYVHIIILTDSVHTNNRNKNNN